MFAVVVDVVSVLAAPEDDDDLKSRLLGQMAKVGMKPWPSALIVSSSAVGGTRDCTTHSHTGVC